MNNIKDRIKIVRDKFNLSQQEFGDRINVTRSTISQFETGAINPSNKTLELISLKFKINLEWLITGQGEMQTEDIDGIMLLLEAKYKLDSIDKKIIYEFLQLSPDERFVIKNYIDKIKK